MLIYWFLIFYRDGSAIELVGLSKATVRWLAELNRREIYPHSGVKVHDSTITFAQWSEKIQTNFERFFWIGQKWDCQDAHPELIHQRCIYKDTYGATEPWTDYQLRPNFPVAMVVVSLIFDIYHNVCHKINKLKGYKSLESV